MSKLCKQLLVAIGLATLASGTALAGDGGDNSMSRWTGESYLAFERSRICEAPPSRDVVVAPTAATGAPPTEAIASTGRKHGGRINPFRDDTAA